MCFLHQQSTPSQPEDTYTQEKLIKIKKNYQSLSFEATTGALHEHLQNRWSQKNRSHLDWTLLKNKQRKTGRRSRRASQEHTLSLSLSLSLRDGLTAAV
jgi:hypothetical protein